MFVVLDTNHYDELTQNSLAGRNARRRIENTQADVFISISVQESVQGWLRSLTGRNQGGSNSTHTPAFRTASKRLPNWPSCRLMRQPCAFSKISSASACALALWT